MKMIWERRVRMVMKGMWGTTVNVQIVKEEENVITTGVRSRGIEIR